MFWAFLLCAFLHSDCKQRFTEFKSPYLVWLWENTDQKIFEYGYFSQSVEDNDLSEEILFLFYSKNFLYPSKICLLWRRKILGKYPCGKKLHRKLFWQNAVTLSCCSKQKSTPFGSALYSTYQLLRAVTVID